MVYKPTYNWGGHPVNGGFSIAMLITRRSLKNHDAVIMTNR